MANVCWGISPIAYLLAACLKGLEKMWCIFDLTLPKVFFHLPLPPPHKRQPSHQSALTANICKPAIQFHDFYISENLIRITRASLKHTQPSLKQTGTVDKLRDCDQPACFCSCSQCGANSAVIIHHPFPAIRRQSLHASNFLKILEASLCYPLNSLFDWARGSWRK